jgi:hypothetical protein
MASDKAFLAAKTALFSGQTLTEKAAVSSAALRSFHNLYWPLSANLDRIHKAKPGKDAASAYGGAYTGNPGKKITGAKSIIEKYVKALSAQEVDYLKGLGFTDPGNDAQKRTDIVNSILCTWDASAAKLMKGDFAGGLGDALTLLARLDEFDATVDGKGTPPLTPDK